MDHRSKSIKVDPDLALVCFSQSAPPALFRTPNHHWRERAAAEAGKTADRFPTRPRRANMDFEVNKPSSHDCLSGIGQGRLQKC
jgi:hypothetical protein